MNNQVCELVGRLARAPQVYIYASSEKPGQYPVVASFGFFEQMLDRSWHFSKLDASASGALAYADTSRDEEVNRHPLVSAVPAARSLLVLRLPQQPGGASMAMVIINPEAALFSDSERIAALRLLMNILTPGLSPAAPPVTGAAPGLSEVAAPFLAMPAEAPPGSESSTVAFLLRTLPVKHRMLARNGFSYTALRTWRAPLRQYQIDALRALKLAPPDSFVREIAREMASAVVSQWGADFIKNVVPVPCGSSGRLDCLSVRIAGQLAEILKCQFVEALSAEPAPGSSHPKKSAKLGDYAVAAGPEGPTLVVDDVFTSGRHMELALKALRAQGVNCFGMSWIAA